MIPFKKGKRVAGQLPFVESFKKAWGRTAEFEADRFAVIDLGVPLDDAIAAAKELALDELKYVTPQKETFKSTHGFWKDRINYFEELRPEVELSKVRRQQAQKIPWKELALNYQKNLWDVAHKEL